MLTAASASCIMARHFWTSLSTCSPTRRTRTELHFLTLIDTRAPFPPPNISLPFPGLGWAGLGWTGLYLGSAFQFALQLPSPPLCVRDAASLPFQLHIQILQGELAGDGVLDASDTYRTRSSGRAAQSGRWGRGLPPICLLPYGDVRRTWKSNASIVYRSRLQLPLPCLHILCQLTQIRTKIHLQLLWRLHDFALQPCPLLLGVQEPEFLVGHLPDQGSGFRVQLSGFMFQVSGRAIPK